ncbi:MAG: carboxypeptidase regulatory-like domain-containing protein [Verrucomicrobiota bacterium]
MRKLLRRIKESAASMAGLVEGKAAAVRAAVLAFGVGLVFGSQGATDTPPLRFMGRLVDTAGQPVPGASVRVYENRGAGPAWARELALRETITTGSDGLFEIPAFRADGVLVASKPGLATTWHQRGGAATAVAQQIVLTPPSTLAGRVVDESGDPVAGAEVSVRLASLQRPISAQSWSWSLLKARIAREYFSTRTDAEGRFRLDNIPTNAVADLAVSKPGKFLAQPQRRNLDPDSLQFRAGRQEIVLKLEPAGFIEGKVVARETGQPLAGVRLSLGLEQLRSAEAGEGEEAVSGADGAFRFSGIGPGAYFLRAVLGTNGLPEWVAEAVPVSVEASQTTSGVQVEATRGGLLEAVVLTKGARQPMAQAEANAFKGAQWEQAVTGSKGVALLRLLPGKYDVRVRADGVDSEVMSVIIETGKTNRLQVELAPPPRITGTLRDPSGAPVPGFHLRVFPEMHSSLYGGLQTDANGRFDLAWRPGFASRTSKCFLLARDPARNLAAAQDLEHGDMSLDLRLEPGLVVAGCVQDIKGKPLTNAAAHLHLWVGEMGLSLDERPVGTDSRGRFEISALPPDRRYDVWVTASGYGGVSRNVQADPQTNRIELDVCVLKAIDRKITGQVVDADGKPVAEARVYLDGDNQPSGRAGTDEHGRFTFGACEGQAWLYAGKSGHAPGSAIAQGGDTNVVISLGMDEAVSRSRATQRLSLLGRPLPDLAQMGLAGDAVPTNKPILLCLFDSGQRPSRRLLRQLAEQHDTLRQKGITVLGLQTAVGEAESFKQWKESNPVPFPVGRVAERSEKTKWAAEVESLPWLILTDAQGRVAAEGFPLEELEARLKALEK